MKIKKIGLLGASGSVGKQTLDILTHKKDSFQLISFSVGKNIAFAKEVLKNFKTVKVISVENKEDVLQLKSLYPKVEIYSGEEGLIKVATADIDLLITGVVGSVGLIPTYKAIEKGITIGLANKETLVAGGDIIMKKAQEKGVDIIPVDSEHSAIYQCLHGENRSEVNKLIITASGGALRDYTEKEIKNVTLKQVLKHPNWSMGQKITIDSATMMNKGLEVIEAHHLFAMPYDKIQALLHRQSVIHSMVEYVDGSIIAQLGTADMRGPIQYALSYPSRQKIVGGKSIDFSKLKELNFESDISRKKYPCFYLALEAGKLGHSYPIVLNAANEIVVKYFLEEKIKYSQIAKVIEQMLASHKKIKNPRLEDIVRLDKQVRILTENKLQKLK